MKSKQEILVDVLNAKLNEAKVGVIVRGITEIDPVAAVTCLASKNGKKYYVSAVGYGIEQQYENETIAVV